MVVGSSQPIVIFNQQPQQPYFSVPQVDPMMSSSIAGNFSSHYSSMASLDFMSIIKQSHIVLCVVFLYF